MTNISLNLKTRKCIPDNQFLGYEGENEVNILIFEFEDGFFDGSALLNIHRGEQKGYVAPKKVGETYELPVENSLLSQKGDVRFQLTITSVSGQVIKFDPFVMTVKDAIDTDAELPEEYPSWIDEANAKLAEMDKAIEDAEKLDAKVEQTENGALITITGRDGVTTAEVLHGTGEGTGGGITVERDPTVPSWAKQPSKPTYTKSEVGLGNVDNVRQYSASNPPPYPVTSVNGKTGTVKIDIPTKVSQLENDSKFASESYVKNEIANAQLGGDSGEIDLSGYATKQDLIEISQELDKKADSDDIPTKISQLTNDSNLATETYVDEEIAKFDFIKVVDVLPETGLPNRIYFVPKSDTQTQDLFDEYVWVNDKWEWITTKQIEVDLTEYAKKEELSTLATKEELANKQDKLDYSIVTLTQAEYDALVSAGTVDENTYYFIKEE